LNEAAKTNDPCMNAIALMFCLCCRVGEIESLHWSDVDFNKKNIHIWSEIRCEKKDGHLIYIEVPYTKSGKADGDRFLNLSPRAISILRHVQKKNPFGKYIFLNQHGGTLRTSYIDRKLKQLCNSAGVIYHSSHKIRFWSVSAEARMGMDLETIRRNAGHSDSNTTLHYIRDIDSKAVNDTYWDSIYN